MVGVVGAQGQLTQGASMRNPRTKYKRSKNVFPVTFIALIIGRDWDAIGISIAQSLIGSPGTLGDKGTFAPPMKKRWSPPFEKKKTVTQQRDSSRTEQN